jgi:hypothetical protein
MEMVSIRRINHGDLSGWLLGLLRSTCAGVVPDGMERKAMASRLIRYSIDGAPAPGERQILHRAT